VAQTTIPRDELLAVLRRAGMADLIPAAERELPDPVDLDEASRWAENHGFSRAFLIERMGGSP